MKVLTILFALFFSLHITYSQSVDLDYYIEQSKVNSPLINSKMNDHKIIQLDMQQIESILTKPVVNLKANLLFAPIISHDNNKDSFQWISNGAAEYTGYDLSYSDGGQYQAFVAINQPLFRGGQRQVFSNAAKITDDINENQINLSIHELEQLVSYQYIRCLKAEKQAEISKKLLDELSKQTDMMEELVRNAIYRQTDLMLLQIEKKNYQLQFTNFSVEYINSLYDLNLLCGINNDRIVHIQDVDFQMKPDTIVHSQFLKSFAFDSLKTISQQSIYNLKYQPQVNIFADVGIHAIYAPSFNRFGFSTGISFAWNIFDGNQKKLQQQKSEIKLESLEFEKQSFITRHDLNKRKYLTQIQSVESKLSLVNKQLEDYKTLLKMYMDEMTQAQISIMDYKNLYKDIAAKKQEKILLQMEKQALINSFNYWNY